MPVCLRLTLFLVLNGKKVAEDFSIDSNEAVELKLVRNVADVEDDSASFNPEMSHQIFGENESIFGYKNLQIQLYYTAGNLTTYLGMKYDAKIDPKRFGGLEADDVLPPLIEKLQPGFHTNLDEFIKAIEQERNFKPFGTLDHAFTVTLPEGTDRHFEVYHCEITDKGFLSYHERLQTFLLWYVDAASFIDVDDDKWTFFLLFEKYTVDGENRYAISGYGTVYRYYAYPNRIRPRISQFLILPPFQRIGLGVELLEAIYRHFQSDPKVLDIAVEDPSEQFVRLRDFVDCKACLKLKSFQRENVRKGFSQDMVQEAQNKLKLNKKQTRRVFEILRFKATNTGDAEDYKQYRLLIKQRLNIPYQKEQNDIAKLRKALNTEELQAAMSMASKEVQIVELDKLYRELEENYRKIIERLATANLN
nr:EOG090X06NC [Triops cancriformis]